MEPTETELLPPPTSEAHPRKSALWTGRIISTILTLFLLMDAVMKLIKPSFVIQSTIQLGYHESVILGLGIVLTICTILYVIPGTTVLGGLLLTGYLGGAVASHLRAGAGPFPVLFPAIFGVLLWTSLVLRYPGLRRVIFLPR
jgi:hypothetical protein